MEESNQNRYDHLQVKCERCGGYMVYSLTTQRLKCRFCGFERELAAEDIPIEKYDYRIWQEEDEKSALDDLKALEPQEVRCPHCGGLVAFGTGTLAKNCDFCGSPLMLSDEQLQRYWKVEGLLPFRLDSAEAGKAFRKSIRHEWFAPERLRRMGTDFSQFKGYYFPFWLYDVDTETDYAVDYQDTRIFKKKGKFKVINMDNKMHKKGQWVERLENVMAPASDHFEYESVLNAQQGGDFEHLVPFSGDYLRGYVAELYSATFLESRNAATEKIKEVVQKHIVGEGAGSVRFSRFTMHQKNTTFRLVLLPFWVSSFRYGDKNYPFVVNARTAQVSGPVPLSLLKCILFFLSLVVFGIAGFFCDEIWAFLFG